MLVRNGKGAAIAVPKSNNKKTGPMAVTYAPIKQSCPRACPFLNNGCYAQGGNMALHGRRIEAEAEGATALAVAKAEADAIDMLRTNGLPLRLHAVGDCRTNSAAKIVAAAAERYMMRCSGIAYTYTHGHQKVVRDSWGGVSVLASIESVTGARKAMKRGYATAIVVPELPEDGKAWKVGKLRLTPCPEQTRGISCIDCGLCFNDYVLLDRGAVIAFGSHGARKKRAIEVCRSAG